MRFFSSIVPSLLLAAATAIDAAASWGFEDATVTVQAKGAGVGSGSKEALNALQPLGKPVSVGAADTLKVILTTTEDKKPKRPHQAFLTLTDPASGLADTFPFNVKESGKAKVELTQKDIPHVLLTSGSGLTATITIGSFGSITPYKSAAFTLSVALDTSMPIGTAPEAIRYHAQPEIHHIFRPDAKSPPKIITIIFSLAVVGALPVLLGTWAVLGANFNHLSKAMGSAPLSHALFYGSIIGLEGIFFLYYTTWNLFQTLPAAAAVGLVAFVSGSRALTEVQERRLAGLR